MISPSNSSTMKSACYSHRRIKSERDFGRLQLCLQSCVVSELAELWEIPGKSFKCLIFSRECQYSNDHILRKRDNRRSCFLWLYFWLRETTIRNPCWDIVRRKNPFLSAPPATTRTEPFPRKEKDGMEIEAPTVLTNCTRTTDGWGRK